MSHFIKIHPGQVLSDELQEQGASQASLARHIGVRAKTVSDICRGKRGIDAEIAVRLASALGASPAFWMNLQSNWELSQVKRVPRISRLRANAA